MGELRLAETGLSRIVAALLFGLGLGLASLVPMPASAASKVDTAEEGDDSTEDLPEDTNRPVPTNAELRARYQMVAADPGPLASFTAPKEPDLSGYTRAAALAKADRSKRARISVDSLLVESGFKPLTSATGRGLLEFASRQRGLLRAIYVENGYIRLSQLVDELPRELFEAVGKGRYVLRLPLLVRHGATLEIGPEVGELRLSQDRGVVLANEGTLIVAGSSITGWNETANAPSKLTSPTEFRPYLISWSGSRTYVADSRIAHLGYLSTKAFGFSLSTYTRSVTEGEVWPRPTGWLLNSTIEDNWYGFYSREADDLVIRGNSFKANQVYGLNIHDGSRRVVVAENTFEDTHQKHGMILSRDVDDSWVLNNKSHGNGLSGIVLDRQCRNNVIAHNLAYKNRASGIVLAESPDNLIYDNVASGNLAHGVRLRNATGVRIQSTSAIANSLAGISAIARDLAGTGRDLKLDPYERSVSMTVVGGQLSANGSGPINIEEPTRIELFDIDLRTPQRALGYRLGGAMLAFQIETLDILMNQKKAALLTPRGGK